MRRFGGAAAAEYPNTAMVRLTIKVHEFFVIVDVLAHVEGLKVGACSADYNGDGQLEVIPKEAYTRIRMQDVEDGTSKTIAIGEAAYTVDIDDYPMWMGSWKEDGSVLFKTRDMVNCNSPDVPHISLPRDLV